MVKIKAIVSYRDLDLKRTILKGEELEVTDERAKVLIEKKLADIVETDSNIVINYNNPEKPIVFIGDDADEIIKNSPEIEEDIIEEEIVKPAKKKK